MQDKLLRVIQNSEIQRVGSPEVKQIHVRLIAATNRDLRAEVLAGRFREDLFYRLSSIQIRIPSLCERLEDIPPLVHFFLKKYSDSYAKKTAVLTRRAQAVPLQHSWSGNVHELENVVSQRMHHRDRQLRGPARTARTFAEPRDARHQWRRMAAAVAGRSPQGAHPEGVGVVSGQPLARRASPGHRADQLVPLSETRRRGRRRGRHRSTASQSIDGGRQDLAENVDGCKNDCVAARRFLPKVVPQRTHNQPA